MALHVTINISTAAGEEYTEHESSILQALAGVSTPAAPAAAPAAAAAPAEKPAPAVAPKAAAKPKAAPKPKAEPKPEPVEEEPAEDAEEPTGPAVLEADDDVVVGPAPTVADALGVATPIITEEGDAGRARVKAALAAAGAARVSQLKGDAITQFITALEG